MGVLLRAWKPELVHRCGRRAMYLYLYCFSPQAVASAVDVLCGLYVLQSRAVAHRPAGDGLSAISLFRRLLILKKRGGTR